jgi:hypothetical protein
VKKNSFVLLELEMADLGCFFAKNGLGPLGVMGCQVQLHSIYWVLNLFSLFGGLSAHVQLSVIAERYCGGKDVSRFQ